MIAKLQRNTELGECLSVLADFSKAPATIASWVNRLPSSTLDQSEVLPGHAYSDGLNTTAW